MTGPRLLVLGATGRVGRLLRPHWPRPRAMWFQHRDPALDEGLYWPDLSDPSPLLEALTDAPLPQAMIVLSGVTSGSQEALDLNRRLALWAVTAAQRAGIRRILVASSSAVYGAGQGAPLAETASLAPVNAYGQAKCAMEAALEPFRADLDICALRIGNVAGADALLLNVARAAADVPILIDRFADGQGPWRSYIGAGTMARVLDHLALAPDRLPSVLNLAAPQAVSMESLVVAAAHPYRLVPAPATAFQHITLDCHRLAALYPFTPADNDPALMVADWKQGRHP